MGKFGQQKQVIEALSTLPSLTAKEPPTRTAASAAVGLVNQKVNDDRHQRRTVVCPAGRVSGAATAEGTAVRERIETEAPQADPKQLEKELATVARKLGKAKQRLLEVDRDMLPIVQDSIRELKARQVQLEAAVKAANLPRGALLETIDERMESVVQRFGQLRQALARADVPMQRDILHQTVKKVEVWSRKTGDNKRAPWLLEHGQIYLRGDNEQLVQMGQFI